MATVSFDHIVSEIRGFATTAKDLTSLQEFCVDIIADRLSHYNWVGFYMLDPNDENVLRPFRGAPRSMFAFRLQKGSAEQQ